MGHERLAVAGHIRLALRGETLRPAMPALQRNRQAPPPPLYRRTRA